MSHDGQKIAEPVRTVGTIAVNGLDAARHADRFGKLGAVNLVVSLYDVRDKRFRRIRRFGFIPLQSRKITKHKRQVDAAGGRGLAEGHAALAAEIYLVTPENSGGAWHCHGDVFD